MKTTLIINTVLSIFVLAYIFSAMTFLIKQKQGTSFTASFDQAIARGGYFFIAGSSLAFVAIMVSNLT